ncbi:MAG: sterol desaturase family protein [Burkholderiaceae bacterium]
MTCFHELLSTAANAWPVIWLMDLSRYVIGATLIASVLALARPAWLGRRLVRIRSVAAGQRRREFAYSMLTVVIFSLVGTSVLIGYHLGWSKIYFEPNQYGWPWLLSSFFVFVVLHDTWFYWTHRAMHHPRIFRWMHRTHHESVAPTPWTAYSFSSAEALVQALYLPLALLVLPVHQAVIFVWMIWMVLRNVMGHSGAELLPRAWLAGWWGRWFTTTLHHEMHHAYGRYNYGLYFVWWDRWCATEHPEYLQRLAALTNRIAEEKADAVARPARIHFPPGG